MPLAAYQQEAQMASILMWIKELFMPYPKSKGSNTKKLLKQD
jgi:hypothetical protein